MPRNSTWFHRPSQHKKDNFSMDIKNLRPNELLSSPFLKKYPIKQKLSLNMKHHLVCNTSIQGSQKQIRGKRRFSLTKTSKETKFMNNEGHFTSQKIHKATKLIAQQKHIEAIPIIRQLLTRDETTCSKNKLYLMYAECLQKNNKLKEAEQYYSRYLLNNSQSYSAQVQRGKIRFQLGAKELALRDLKNAIYSNPKNIEAYLQLHYCYSQLGNQKQAVSVLFNAINNQTFSLEIVLKGVQSVITNTGTVTNAEQTILLLQKIFNEISHEKQISSNSQSQCLKGLICEFRSQLNQACIYYESCLKFNSSKFAETIAIERLINCRINQRDYYSAYHTINRLRVLNTNEKYIEPYIVFLDGVMLIMKKKFDDGIGIHQNLLNETKKSNSSTKNTETIKIKVHLKAAKILQPLLYKFLAYANFKMGKHEKTIEYYEKLFVFGHDECSSYNLLLAQGIVNVERRKNYQLGMEKFEQAKYIYSMKAEPYIYTAMTIIYREISRSKKKYDEIEKNQLVSAVVHAIEEMNEADEITKSSSSNLLFHRSILHLFLNDFHQGLEDINLCIEKAQQNQPKYFYVRGLCYAIIGQMRKAINQFSISLSLNSQHFQSLLERAKSYFLLGETQSGFNDLKVYMQRNPDDYNVHKWIGDLLYEGYSYNDSYKAYGEIEQGMLMEAELMKAKCLIRVGTLEAVQKILIKVSKMEDCDDKKMNVDLLSIKIVQALSKPIEKKQLIKKIKDLNSQLEYSRIGYVFDLIDCMNVLGLASLYANNFQEAYQSFILTAELFPSLQQKYKMNLKSDISEQICSLSLHDIYLNMVIALLGMKDYNGALKILKQEFLLTLKSEKSVNYICKILEKVQIDEKCADTFRLQNQNVKNQKIKLKPFDLKFKSLKIKCTPVFSLYHKNTEYLYSDSVINSITKQFHPSYIDNMPEGPWIKRNDHGVIFTDHIIEEQIGSSLISSMRDQKYKKEESEQLHDSYNEESSQDLCREQFKKKLALDPAIERKLNSIIFSKSERSEM